MANCVPKLVAHGIVPQHRWNPITHDSYGASEPTTQTGFPSSHQLKSYTSPLSPAWNWRRALSCQRMLAFLSHWGPHSVTILYSGTPLSPLKITPCHGGNLDPNPIEGSLGTPKSSAQTASRSLQPFLRGSLVWQTARQTERQTDRQTTQLGR